MTDELPPGDDELHQDPSDRTSLASLMVGLLVVALMALVAVLGFGARDDGDVVTTDEPDAAPSTTSPTSPTTMAPPEPDPVEPSEPLGADSPIVGLTEARVRNTYVIVRVVERDGEPQMATMDLVPGRINLSVRGDRVVGASTEACDDPALNQAEAPRWLQQACDPRPDTDGPDVTGTLRAPTGADGAGAGGDTLALDVDADSDDYYQGLAVTPDADAMLRQSDGAPLGPQELAEGDTVRIWTAGSCRESSPVQCDIQAIVVQRSPGD